MVSRDFLSLPPTVPLSTAKTLSVTMPEALADRSLTWQDSPKHATKPLFKPATYPAILDKPDVIRIGISIAAGNKAKTVPPVIWKRIIDRLADLPCEFYVFGAPDEQSWLDDITRAYGDIPNLISLIGRSRWKNSRGLFQRWIAISRLIPGIFTLPMQWGCYRHVVWPVLPLRTTPSRQCSVNWQ